MDDNFQNAAEDTKLSGISRRDRQRNENLELNISTDTIKPHSEPNLCTKTLLVDYDAGHTNKHLFIRENQGDKFCVVSGNSKINTNLPNTSKFTKFVFNNESINNDEDKENVSHNPKKYFFDLSEESVPCNRTVILNQNIIVPDINNARSNSKTSTSPIKSISKTASEAYSLDPEDSFLTLEKQINALPSTATDWQPNINMIILGNNKEQTPCKNMDFNVLKIQESNEISELTIKKSHSNIDTVSKESKLITPCVEALTSIESKEPGNQKSYGISNQNIAKHNSDFGEISIECEQTTPNIKTGLSVVSVVLSQDVKDIIHKNDSSPVTDNEIEQLFGSSSSSESSDAYDNTLEYIEYKLNYKPKNKAIRKLQINEKLYKESLAMRELISETKCKLTGSPYNKQYYNPSLDTLSEERNSKISNINTVTSSELEDVSLYRDPVYTDNDSPMTESKVKELCDTPGNLKSNEIFSQNIAKYNSDFGEISIECEQTTPNIKTGLSIASDAVSQDIKDIINKNDSSPATDNEIEKLSGSPTSSESSDACDNTLEYVEHMLKYKPKNKGIDKLQILNEILYQESLANREPISETDFKSTEDRSNKHYYIPSLDTHSEETKSKIPNINTGTSSESEDVSLYRDPVYTDNDSPMTESKVKELCDTPGNLKSNEIFSQNIAKYNSDFGEISIECEQTTPNIKTGLSIASDAVSQDIKDIINKKDSSPGTDNEIENLSGSPTSSESSDACDNTLEYVEHMLKYKPKNKGIDKLQILNEILYQESLANREPISETDFKSTEESSNKHYYIPSLDTHSEETKSKIPNINTGTSSESEDVSPYRDPLYTDTDSPMTECQVKELCYTPGNFKSNEIFNQNIAQYNSDFGKTSTECDQITPNIKSGLSVASDTISPMIYNCKNKCHEKQIQDKNNGINSLERTDTVGGTHLNKQYDANFHIPLIKLNTSNLFSSASSTESMSTDCEAVLKDNIFLPLENQLEKVTLSQGNPKLNEMIIQNNKKYAKHLVMSQPNTPKIKISSPNVLKKSPATSVKKTPNKSNKYQYIQSPVAAYIHHSPQVPLVKDVYPKKQLPSTSRKMQEVTGSGAMKSSNKENINLPLVAYKSAKETKVMEIPDKNKLPKCPWAKQMTSSPQPIVVKHEYRVFNSQGTLPMSEDSHGNLPLFQADLSVCTQKIAFDDKKN